MRWELFAPDGTWVLNSAGGTFSGTLGDLGAFTLMQTGSYRLRVYDPKGIVGSYEFAISQVLNPQAFNIGAFDANTTALLGEVHERWEDRNDDNRRNDDRKRVRCRCDRRGKSAGRVHVPWHRRATRLPPAHKRTGLGFVAAQ